MLFEKNDSTDIKSSTDVVDARLNKKDISACAYIYWEVQALKHMILKKLIS